jgi:hypothetical protein
LHWGIIEELDATVCRFTLLKGDTIVTDHDASAIAIRFNERALR